VPCGPENQLLAALNECLDICCSFETSGRTQMVNCITINSCKLTHLTPKSDHFAENKNIFKIFSMFNLPV